MSLVTHAEAAARWCPAARVADVQPDGYLPPVAYNRAVPEGVQEPANCNGSNCMAWRWFDSAAGVPDGKRLGYCGLAHGALFR